MFTARTPRKALGLPWWLSLAGEAAFVNHSLERRGEERVLEALQDDILRSNSCE